MVPAMGDVYLSIATRSRHLIVLAGKTKLYVVVITRGPIVFEVGSTLPPAPANTKDDVLARDCFMQLWIELP